MGENGLTVLVIDDGRDNREFIVDYVLKPHGFTPLEARDGVEGMAHVRQYKPDIILLDLQMPRMNGMQVLDALQEEGWDIPVILMTFHGSEEVAIEVYRKGVRDYVKKPYTVDEMLQAMDRCLSEVRLRREKDALTERLLHANTTLNRRIRELNTLYQIGKSVTALMGMDELMIRIVDAATQVVGAEQGCLLLLEGDQLVCRAIKQHSDPHAVPTNDVSSNRIAWQAVRTAKPIVPSVEELRKQRARNPMLPSAIACIPLLIGKQVVGVLYVENVRDAARPFTKQDGAMLSALGDYAAIAIENSRIYAALEEMSTSEKESIRSAFARYVAPSVVERVLHNPSSMQLGGKRREISVLFADVRGFTAYSEQALPEEVVKLLNEYFSLATDVIFSREGTLDKFLGDAVMAIFNAPEEQYDHTYRAVDAALALQAAISERNARANSEELTFGIGVHLGDAVVGNIGTLRAMNYTAIGDTVNVAKRLQERAAPGEVLITAEVAERLGDLVEVEYVGKLEIKGRQRQAQVYRLLALA
ncbi:MAG: response regulator, partial [Anaerolineae bacterium]|nr:response regulator [Anaerolineae bacterium]